MAIYQPRASALVCAFNADFKTQSAFGTPLPVALLNSSFPLTDRQAPERAETTELVKDCSGQFNIRELVKTRQGILRLQFAATPAILAGIAALCMGRAAAPVGTPSGTPPTTGAPYIHLLSMLGVEEFQPPATSLIMGFRNSDGEKPVRLKDCVVNNFEVTIPRDGVITASAEVRCHGEFEEVNDFDMPECADVEPARREHCQLKIGADDLTDRFDTGSFNYSNALLTGDDPFIGVSPDIQRMERADERTYGYKFGIAGVLGDARHALMRERAERPVSLRVGNADDNVTFISPVAVLRPDGSGLAFDGEARRSLLRFDALPLYRHALPVRAEATLASQTRLLEAA